MSRYNVISTIFLSLFIGSLILEGFFSIPWAWYVAITLLFILFNLYGSFSLRAQYFMPAHIKGMTTDAIAITFDDGPIGSMTDKILDILNAYDVRATFFCVGKQIAQYPELIQRIDAEGHILGNHAFDHTPFFTLKSSTMVQKELSDTDALIFKITGRRLRLFRPPYGVTNPMIAKAVARRNYTVIGWSLRSLDSVISTPEKLKQRLTRSVKGGDIVLFHDYSDTTISVLPDFIEHVLKSGLKIIPVNELIHQRPYAK